MKTSTTQTTSAQTTPTKRTAQIIRTLTVSTDIIVELPENLSAKELEDILYDRNGAYEAMKEAQSPFDFEEIDEEITVRACDSPIVPIPGNPNFHEDFKTELSEDLKFNKEN